MLHLGCIPDLLTPLLDPFPHLAGRTLIELGWRHSPWDPSVQSGQEVASSPGQPALQGADGYLPEEQHLLKLQMDPPAREGRQCHLGLLVACCSEACRPACPAPLRQARTHCSLPGNSPEQLGSEAHQEQGLCVAAAPGAQRSLPEPQLYPEVPTAWVVWTLESQVPSPAGSSCLRCPWSPRPHADPTQTPLGD